MSTYGRVPPLCHSGAQLRTGISERIRWCALALFSMHCPGEARLPVPRASPGSALCSPDWLLTILSPLSSTTTISPLAVTVQPTFLPLPAARPLVVIVPIMSLSMLPPTAPAGPSDSTPSAVCFPIDPRQHAMASPLDRALAHLRRAKRELDELAEDLAQIVLLGAWSCDLACPFFRR